MQFLSRRSIRVQLMLLVVISILPALAIIIYSGLEQRHIKEEEEKSTTFSLMQTLANRQQVITESSRQFLITLSRIPAVQNLDVQACNALFRRLLAENPVYGNLFMLSRDGIVLASAVPTRARDLKDRKYFKEAMSSRGFSTGEYIVARITGFPVFTYSYPVWDDNGDVKGVLAVNLNLGRYDHVIADANLPEKSVVVLSDHKGTRVYRYPEGDKYAGLQVQPELLDPMKEGPDEGIFTAKGVDGIKRFYAYKKLRLSRDASPYLYLRLGIPEEKVLREIWPTTRRNLIILGIVFVLALASAWYFGGYLISNPLINLVKTTERFRRGELGVTTGLPHADNELGQLAAAFDKMSLDLKSREEERKLDEEALRSSEEKYHLIFSNISDGIVMIDSDLKYTDISPNVEMLLGYKTEEILGKSLNELDIMTPESRQRAVSALLRALEGEQIEGSTYEFIAKDGSSRFGETRSMPVFKEGRVIGVTTVIRDITERMKSEESLRHSEEMLRGIFKATPVGLSIMKDRVYQSSNKTWYDSFGYSEAEMVGKGTRILYQNDEEYERVGRELYTGLAQRGLSSTQTRLLRKDGSVRDVILTAAPLNSSDSPQMSVIAIQDITDLKKAEENLEANRRNLENIIEFLPDATLIINKYRKVIAWNRAIEIMTGIRKEDIIGKGSYEYAIPFYGERRPILIDLALDPDTEMEKHYTAMKRSGDIIFGEAYAPNLPPGNIHISITASVLRDSHGEIIGAIECIRNNTERRIMESQLQQAQKMEAIGTLAGGIAHDFNNILAAIIGYTELTVSALKDTQSAAMLGNVLRAAERATDLTRQILTFSRKTEQEKRLIDPGIIVKEALKLLRPTLPSTIEIRQAVDPGLHFVLADPTQIHQILINLCTNAAHAMLEKGGVLGISIGNLDLSESSPSPLNLRPGPYVVLAVSDTGKGIESANLHRIFDPFFTTKEKGMGTGLGLSVVYGIVKECGGTVTVDSELGKGSIFRVYLPAAERAYSAGESRQAAIPTGSERVLFVDDEPDIANVYREMLSELGYSVLSVTNSVRALEIIRDDPHSFDLVITDMTMPGMTGMALAKELLKTRPGLPVILCTGYSELVTEETTREAGIREVFNKPLLIKDLAAGIRRVLDGPVGDKVR